MRADKLQTNSYKTGRRGLRAAVCLLLGAGILMLSWRLRAGGTLPFHISGSTATPAVRVSASPQRTEAEISLSARTWYALQLGAFTQEASARQLAQEYIARGAAGYVHRDTQAFRVLAAAYPTRAEAQIVQTRLSAQNVAVYIHTFSQPALSLRAQGEEMQVQAVQDALLYLDALPDKLCTLFCALDSHDTDEAAARSALQSEGVTCAQLRKKLASAFHSKLPDALAPLDTLLSDLAAAGEAIQNETGAARIGAALKHCQLTAAVGMMEFCLSLQAP